MIVENVRELSLYGFFADEIFLEASPYVTCSGQVEKFKACLRYELPQGLSGILRKRLSGRRECN
jgi:hypothetical protein